MTAIRKLTAQQLRALATRLTNAADAYIDDPLADKDQWQAYRSVLDACYDLRSAACSLAAHEKRINQLMSQS